MKMKQASRGRPPKKRVRILGEGRSTDAQIRQKLYRSREWHQVRAVILKDNPWCQCGVRAEVVDHADGHQDAGWRERFFTGPFVTMCTRCHNIKSANELPAYKRYGREQS